MKWIAVVGPALAAALLFAVSATLQQRAAGRAVRAAPTTGRWLPVVTAFGRLLRDRWWLLGQLLNVGAFVLHAVALHLGSITVVQSLLLSQLIFAHLVLGRQPALRDWAGSVTVVAGLVLLLVVRRAAVVHPQRAHVPLVALIIAGTVGALLIIGRLLPEHLGWLRGLVVGLGAGVCFSLTAVLVVVAGGDLVRGGIPALLGDWVAYGVVASTAASTVLVQDAFAAGSLVIAMTAMTIADPVSSAVIDLTVLDPGQRPGLLGGIAYTSVGLLLTLGVILLVGSPTRRAERHVPEADPVPAIR